MGDEEILGKQQFAVVFPAQGKEERPGEQLAGFWGRVGTPGGSGGRGKLAVPDFPSRPPLPGVQLR